MPPLCVVPSLAAHPGSRLRRSGKGVSGGLKCYPGSSVFEKRCGTRESALPGWEVRWGAALSQTGQGLTGPPGHLDDLQQQVKDAAIKAGAVSGQKFGKLNVFAYGGTAEERAAALSAMGDVFTKSAQGAQELKALEARTNIFGKVKPFDVVMARNPNGSYTYKGSQGMALDMSQVGRYGQLFSRPGGGFTLQRLIAHELGHAAMGVGDDGPNRMNNVLRYENTIMRELGDTNDRIRYSP